jgi:cell shape-determining protein MreC
MLTPTNGVVLMNNETHVQGTVKFLERELTEERQRTKAAQLSIKVLREENEQLKETLAEALDIGRNATKLTQDLIDKVRDANRN